MSHSASNIWIKGASNMGTIFLTLVLDAPLAHGIVPTLPSLSSSAAAAAAAAPPPSDSVRGRDGSAVSRLSFHDAVVIFPGDSTTLISLQQLVRQDLQAVVGVCHDITVNLMSTCDSSSPAKLSVTIVPWSSERVGLLTMTQTLAKLLPYVGQRAAFSSLCAFIGNIMEPSCMPTINAVNSSLNGIPFSALRSHLLHQANEEDVGKPIEIEAPSPLSYYRRALLQDTGSLENVAHFAQKSDLSNREERTPMRKEERYHHSLARHSAVQSASHRHTERATSPAFRWKSSVSAFPSRDVSSASAASHPTLFSPLDSHPIRSGSEMTTLMSLTPDLPSPSDGLMARRTQVHVVTLLPKSLSLEAFQRILVTGEAVSALREDIVGQALVDCCKPADVQIDVRVHPGEGMTNRGVPYCCSGAVVGASSLHGNTLCIAVDVPMRLELAVIYALADHLLATDAFATWLSFVWGHIGLAHAHPGLDVANTYVNGMPVSFLEEFLSKCWGTFGTFFRSAVVGNILADIGNDDDDDDDDDKKDETTGHKRDGRHHASSELMSSTESPTPELLSVCPHPLVRPDANSFTHFEDFTDEEGRLLLLLQQQEQAASIMEQNTLVQEEIERRRSFSHQETVESELSELEELPPFASPIFSGVHLKKPSHTHSSVA